MQHVLNRVKTALLAIISFGDPKSTRFLFDFFVFAVLIVHHANGFAAEAT